MRVFINPEKETISWSWHVVLLAFHTIHTQINASLLLLFYSGPTFLKALLKSNRQREREKKKGSILAYCWMGSLSLFWYSLQSALLTYKQEILLCGTASTNRLSIYLEYSAVCAFLSGPYVEFALLVFGVWRGEQCMY